MMRRPRSLMTLAASAVVAAVFTVVPPASATGDQFPVVTNPYNDQTVPGGWTGPVTVDFSNAPDATYDVNIDCGMDYSAQHSFTSSSDTAQMSWTLDTPLPPNESFCWLTLKDPDGTQQLSFSTGDPLPPPLAIQYPSASPAIFYPLVVDGYRDATRFSYTLTRDAAVVATVVSKDTGKRVRQVKLGKVRAGDRTWAWNGRNNNDAKVATGIYKITLAASTGGKTVQASKSVTVATGWKVTHHQSSRGGDQGNPATKGNCSITRDRDARVATLDCWGGRYAQMTYNFSLPAGAYNLKWQIAARAASSDICCTGRIIKATARPNATHAFARVKVSGWRAADASKVTLGWSTKLRI